MPELTSVDFRVSIRALVAAAENHLRLTNLIGESTTELQGIARMLLGTKVEGSSVVDLSIHGFAPNGGVKISMSGTPADVARFAKAFQELLG